jgi:hypothetical protein
MPYLRWIGSLLLVGMAGISFAATAPIEKSAGVVDSGYERFIDSCGITGTVTQLIGFCSVQSSVGVK